MTDEKIKTVLKTIFSNLSEKTIGKADQLSYDEIQAADLPRQIRTFLLAELEFTARTYVKSIKSARFNFQDDSISEARNAFVRHLIKTVTLKREDYLKLLDMAVVIQFRYLCRPQKMLAEQVFGQMKEQSAAEIADRLRNFSDYRYLVNVFLQYLEKKKIESITREKFEKIIFGIDQKITDSYDDHDFLMLLKPIYEFFDLGGETEVPVIILTEFIREKSVPRLEKILYELTAKGLKSLSLKDFDLLLHGRNDQIFEEALVIKEREPEPMQTDVLPEPPQQIEIEQLPLPKPEPPQQVMSPPLPKPEPLQKTEIEQLPLPEPEAQPEPAPELNMESAKETPREFPRVPDKETPAPPPPVFPAEAYLGKKALPIKEEIIIKFDESDIVEQIKESLAAFTPAPKPKKSEDDKLNSVSEQQAGLADNAMILDDSNVPDQAPQEGLGLESTLSLLSKIPSFPPPQTSRIEVSEEFLESVVPEKPVETPKLPDPDELKDLRELIGEADRKKFIKRVFKGNAEIYEEAISQLNAARSWREASLYIDEEIFLRHKVDEYSQEAVLFTDIVFSRYKNQSK